VREAFSAKVHLFLKLMFAFYIINVEPIYAFVIQKKREKFPQTAEC